MNNQLDLFEGRILTDVQRRMKKSYIEQCYKNNSKIKKQEKLHYNRLGEQVLEKVLII